MIPIVPLSVKKHKYNCIWKMEKKEKESPHASDNELDLITRVNRKNFEVKDHA